MASVAVVAEKCYEDVFCGIIDQNVVESVPKPAVVDQLAVRPLFKMPSIAVFLGRYFAVFELVLRGGGHLYSFFG